MEDNKKLIEVKDLKVSFFTPVGEVKAVDGINYSLGYNEVMGIVGESGSGKSVEAFSIMGLLAGSGKVKEGSEILLEGKNILNYTKAEMEDIRGKDISMIFQNPMTCLNPSSWKRSAFMTRPYPRQTQRRERSKCLSWLVSTTPKSVSISILMSSPAV